MLGRYLIFGEIGSGGSATVHFGRLRGPAGFGRTVALKRLHGHLANDPKHVSQFLAEARLTARIHHPNVVPLLDVIALPDGELLLVMDYVHGETMGGLLGTARRRQARMPLPVASAIMTGVLLGLHAAHETASESGAPLGLVHGDVSPHNVIVGADGSARVLDFGIARVAGATIDKQRVMGTPAYMAPERFREAGFDRRSDVFGAAVVLWEMLTLDRLFRGQGEPPSAERAVRPIPPPSTRNPAVPASLDAVVLKALKARPEDRYPTALAFARALETAAPPATSREVAEWVTEICGVRLRERSAELARIEAVTTPELVSANDLRKDQTGDEDALSFSVMDVGDPLPVERDPRAARSGRTRPGLPLQTPRLRPAPVNADEEPTAIETEVDPRLLEAMRPSTPEPVAASLRLVTADPLEAPTVIEPSTAAATAVIDRRHPLPVPVAPAAPAMAASMPAPVAGGLERALLDRPAADRGPRPDRPSLDRALQDRGRETTPGLGRTASRPAFTDVGAVENAASRNGRRPSQSFPARDSGSYATQTSELSELGRASRRPRTIALCALASVSIIVLAVVVRSSGGRPAVAPAAAAVVSPPVAVARAPVPAPAPAPVVAPPPAAPERPATGAPARPPAAGEPAGAGDVAEALPAVATRLELPGVPMFRLQLPGAPVVAAPPELSAPAEAPPGPADEPAIAAGSGEAQPVAAAAQPLLRPAAARAGAGGGTAALNRRAMAAYDRLDLDQAMDLLRRALQTGGSRQLVALTHVHLGVVLAGGFKQPGLAVKHFRIARGLVPDAAPAPRLFNPEVGAAFREAAAATLARR
jgi:serine/threonine-protein kinase